LQKYTAQTPNCGILRLPGPYFKAFLYFYTVLRTFRQPEAFRPAGVSLQRNISPWPGFGKILVNRY
jgi:hypothetical protein